MGDFSFLSCFVPAPLGEDLTRWTIVSSCCETAASSSVKRSDFRCFQSAERASRLFCRNKNEGFEIEFSFWFDWGELSSYYYRNSTVNRKPMGVSISSWLVNLIRGYHKRNRKNLAYLFEPFYAVKNALIEGTKFHGNKGESDRRENGLLSWNFFFPSLAHLCEESSPRETVDFNFTGENSLDKLFVPGYPARSAVFLSVNVFPEEG